MTIGCGGVEASEVLSKDVMLRSGPKCSNWRFYLESKVQVYRVSGQSWGMFFLVLLRQLPDWKISKKQLSKIWLVSDAM